MKERGMQFCGAWIVTAFMMAASPGIADTIDCGPRPSLPCLAPHIFELARTLPESRGYRYTGSFVERELAPWSKDVALRRFLWDGPDPAPWEHLDWIARAGRFDQAITLAKKADTPLEKAGGLIAIADRLAAAKDVRRSAVLLDQAEAMLPAIKDPDYLPAVVKYAAEVWARIGQFRRAARLVRGAKIVDIEELLVLAGKYPLHASDLRGRAWAQAERAMDPHVWRRVLEDAAERGDKEAALHAARRALATNAPDDALSLVVIATNLLKANLRDLAGEVIEPWPTWLSGNRDKQVGPLIYLMDSLVATLVQLGRESDIEAAVHLVPGFFSRSSSFSKAADQLFRGGQHALAEKLDAEALAIAESTPVDSPTLQWEHDAGIHNVALSRARRGDVAGAMAAVEKMRDAARRREVTFYVVEQTPAQVQASTAGALERLKQAAVEDCDANLLVKIAADFFLIGSSEAARNTLSQALTWQGAARDPKFNISGAAALMWRLEDDVQAVLSKLDGFAITELQRNGVRMALIRELIPLSPGESVKLAGEFARPEDRFEALVLVATRLAETQDELPPANSRRNASRLPK